jgi:hypothetical protein
MTPHVHVADGDHVVLIPALTAVRAEDLRQRRGELVRYRDEIVAALDYLFLGV